MNVKIFADPSRAQGAPRQGVVVSEQVLAAAPAVFQRWIRESVVEELLIDVADYRHVPAGPGVVLVGHEANYSLDNGASRLGLLYNRKAPIEAGAAENIAQALRAALAACRRLEEEPEFEGKLRFGRDIEIIINDRALAPNTDDAFASLEPAIESALQAVYGAVEFHLERLGAARERLRIAVHAPREQ
ncbi:MAG: hypothetical protein ABSF25_00960 [Bryobacteraceae bacterium]